MQCHQKGKEIDKQSEVNNVAHFVYSQFWIMNSGRVSEQDGGWKNYPI